MVKKSARRIRRTHTSVFKAQVAVTALREDKTLGELVKQFELHPNQITEWKRRLLEHAADAFGATEAVGQVDLAPLHAKIGQLTLEAIHAKEVIEQTLARWGTPEIVNTDRGSQFTAEEFTSVVLGAGCKLSMDGRGAWRDNVFVERLWRSVKYERVYLKAYDSVSAARSDIAEYLAWYNVHRAHSRLERRTPDEKDFTDLPHMKQAA